MARRTGDKLTTRQMSVAAVLIVLFGGGAYFLAPYARQEAPAPDPEQVAAVPESDGGEAASETPETDTETDAPDTDAPAQDEATAPDGPTFDVVRIDASGSALIAGTAAPLADVTVILDDAEISWDKADSSGQFVSLFNIPPSDVPRVISLMMESEGNAPILSSATVIVQPNSVEAPRPAPATEDVESVDPPEIAEAAPETPDAESKPPVLDLDTAALAAPPETGALPPVEADAAPEPDEEAAPGEPDTIAEDEETGPLPEEEPPVAVADVPDLAPVTPGAPPPVDTAPVPGLAAETNDGEAEAGSPEVADVRLGTSGSDAPSGEAVGESVNASVKEDESPEAVVSSETGSATAPEVADTAGETTPEGDEQPDVLAAAEPPTVDTTVAEPDLPSTTGGGAVPEITEESPLPDATPAPEAPTVLLADDSGIRVLQDDSQPNAQTVVIDTISYDLAGEVFLGGRGVPGAFVRVYLDNEPIKTTEIGDDGQWRTPLPDVDTGIYTLRIDEVDAEGTVTSRVETPFYREEPELLARLAGTEEPAEAPETEEATVAEGGDAEPEVASIETEVDPELPVAPEAEPPVETASVAPADEDAVTSEGEVVIAATDDDSTVPEATTDTSSPEVEPEGESAGATVVASASNIPATNSPRPELLVVQPGNTLWGIASERYGEGYLYVRVYEANKERIRDPHWIYPGQVFAVPTEE